MHDHSISPEFLPSSGAFYPNPGYLPLCLPLVDPCKLLLSGKPIWPSPENFTLLSLLIPSVNSLPLLPFVPLAPPYYIVSSQEQGHPSPLVLNCFATVLSTFFCKTLGKLLPLYQSCLLIIKITLLIILVMAAGRTTTRITLNVLFRSTFNF